MPFLPRPTRALGLGAALLLSACQSEPTGPAAPIASHEPQALELSLSRDGSGPYVEGTTERLRAVAPEALDSVRWDATAGRLETQGDAASWRLPAAGTASLTVTAVTKSGQELSATYHFRVMTAPSALVAGEPSTLAAPGAVDASGDDTGQICELAFDTSGKGHIVYHNNTHPSLWYGTWTGTTWTTEQVDGLGLGVGGIVNPAMDLVVASDGTPHIAYWMTARGTPTLWYATRSNGAWVREPISLASAPTPYYGDVAIVLDPSQGNRPTVVFTAYPLNSNGYSSDVRVAVAWRTGARTWAGAPLTYNTTQNQNLLGEAVISSSGTLFFAFGDSYYGIYHLGSYRPGGGLDSINLAAFPSNVQSMGGRNVSLAWAGPTRLLARAPAGIFDFNLASPMSGTSVQRHDIEQSSVAFGDIAYAGGKPYVAHLHDFRLELATTRPDNYWTYTQLGSAQSTEGMGLAVRPTTGQPHLCYRSGNKVMFQ
jgi:hypothetical protein